MEYAYVLFGSEPGHNSPRYSLGVFSSPQAANEWLVSSGMDKKFYPQCLALKRFAVDKGTATGTVFGYPFK